MLVHTTTLTQPSFMENGMSSNNTIPTNPRVQDLRGKSVGKLRVIGYAEKRKDGHYWTCICECGNTRDVHRGDIQRERTKSCGCHLREMLSKRARTHGMFGTPEYKSWEGMIQRCCNKNDRAWPKYGGRGISICERWRHSFQNFFADMGKRPAPKMQVDRIDTNGNYEPGNCRWATSKQNNRNRRNNRILIINGVSHCVSEWSELSGIRHDTICARIRSGWTLEKAVFTPARKTGR